MPQRALTILLATILPAASAGCAAVGMTALQEPMGIASLSEPERPLIFLHGFLGSKLHDPETERVAWGTMANILLHGHRDLLALGIDEQDSPPGERLEPFEIYDSLWGVEYYGRIVRALPTVGGYRLGDIDDPQPGDTAFVFVFDWRRDLVESARRLADAVDRVKLALGTPEVDLLAHSQGGLLARYYVKYGRADLAAAGERPVPTMAGAASVRKLVLLGTPNQGCMEALKALHEGIKKKLFHPIRPEAIFTMPALYQMLPTRDHARFVDLDGDPVELDLYDPATWVEQGWSVFAPRAQERIRRRLHLEGGGPEAMEVHNARLIAFLGEALSRAERFQQALQAPAAGGPPVAYHAFGSDCRATLTAALVVDEPGRRTLQFDLEGIREPRRQERLRQALFESGDGLVSIQSLLAIPYGDEQELDPAPPRIPPLESAFFVCKNHGVLGNDPIFQKNLFYLLRWDAPSPQANASPPLVSAGPEIGP